MKQLVSILIPAYNAERWIASAIESSLAQTWSRTEIIVVDDGSTDRTLEVATAHSSGKVTVVTQDNLGSAAARNRALSLAQGDYIQWLDADDLLAPEKIETQMETADSGQSSEWLLSGSWGQFYHSTEKALFRPTVLWETQDPSEWLFRKVDQNLWMAIESWLVSRKLTDLTGPWNPKLSLDDDGEYFTRVLAGSKKVVFIPESRSFCRKGNFGSISRSLKITETKLQSQLFAIGTYIRVLRSMEESPRTQAACMKLLRRWAIYFYPETPTLFGELKSLAEGLGDRLDPPVLPRKYRWMQKLLGWSVAKTAWRFLPAFRSVLEKYWEEFSWRIGKNVSFRGAK